MKKTFIVIAAYNESKKIARVIDDIKKEGYINIVVVDDGSSDNTYKIIEDKKVFSLKHFINRGQGAALKTGIDFSLSKGADIIVTFDADGQFLAGEIKCMVQAIKKREADVALGSRFLGRAINIPFLKKAVLKAGVFVVFILYRINISDSQCGFRAFSREAAEKIEISSDRMEHASEIFAEIMRNKLKYIEVPVTVVYDDYSIAKGQGWSRGFSLGINMLIKKFMR